MSPPASLPPAPARDRAALWATPSGRLPALVPALACLLVGLLSCLLLGTSPAGAAAPAADAPLDLTITSLTPTYVTDRGPIRITGTVTNTTDETWLAVNVLPFFGTSPITTGAGLEDALASDPASYVGDRVDEVGQFDPIGRLSPGQTASYSIRLSQSFLGIPDTPGVYWFGVHASGETVTRPRDLVADGRARTFLARVPDDLGPSAVSFVVPVRHRLTFTPDGRVADVDGWIRDLEPGGVLHDVTSFAEVAQGRPVTWLIDPAVVQAVQDLADGNPARDLGPTRDPAEEPGPGRPSPSGPPGDGASDPPGDVAASPTGPDPGGTRGLARSDQDTALAWLQRLRALAAAQDRLLLPYGDLDVAAAARHDAPAYERARRLAGATARDLGLGGEPVVAPLDGELPRDAIDALPRHTTVLIDHDAVDDPGPRIVVRGHLSFLTDNGALDGGPGPSAPLAPVAVRQRLLAEAAVRLLREQRGLVVVLDPGAIPQVNADFLAGLRATPWLRITSLTGLASKNARVPLEALADSDAARELPVANFAAAEDLVQSGRTLDDILPLTDTLAADVRQEAMAGLSWWRRDSPTTARRQVLRTLGSIDQALGSIRVSGQPVTLSSERGSFSATVVNGLDRPVEVILTATSDDQLAITQPDPIRLAARSQVTQLLGARATLLGVHQVELGLTDSRGTRLGEGSTITVRASQVSDLIWIVIALGGLLMGAAIVRRLTHRLAQWWRARHGVGA